MEIMSMITGYGDLYLNLFFFFLFSSKCWLCSSRDSWLVVKHVIFYCATKHCVHAKQQIKCSDLNGDRSNVPYFPSIAKQSIFFLLEYLSHSTKSLWIHNFLFREWITMERSILHLNWFADLIFWKNNNRNKAKRLSYHC